MIAEARTPRQREILEVARRLLADEGVEALTLGRIARELGFRLVGHRLELYGVPLRQPGKSAKS